MLLPIKVMKKMCPQPDIGMKIQINGRRKEARINKTANLGKEFELDKQKLLGFSREWPTSALWGNVNTGIWEMGSVKVKDT